MLAKFSVKKPMTIVVAVILIIILGVMSFLNTGVDPVSYTHLDVYKRQP